MTSSHSVTKPGPSGQKLNVVRRAGQTRPNLGSHGAESTGPDPEHGERQQRPKPTLPRLKWMGDPVSDMELPRNRRDEDALEG